MDFNFTDFMKIVLIAVVLWTGWKFAEPHWDKYWIEKTMEKVALFTADNNREKGREKLRDMLLGDGYDYVPVNNATFMIDGKTVEIELYYEVPVIILDKNLYEYQFELRVKKTKAESSMY